MNDDAGMLHQFRHLKVLRDETFAGQKVGILESTLV